MVGESNNIDRSPADMRPCKPQVGGQTSIKQTSSDRPIRSSIGMQMARYQTKSPLIFDYLRDSPRWPRRAASSVCRAHAHSHAQACNASSQTPKSNPAAQSHRRSRNWYVFVQTNMHRHAGSCVCLHFMFAWNPHARLVSGTATQKFTK